MKEGCLGEGRREAGRTGWREELETGGDGSGQRAWAPAKNRTGIARRRSLEIGPRGLADENGAAPGFQTAVFLVPRGGIGRRLGRRCAARAHPMAARIPAHDGNGRAQERRRKKNAQYTMKPLHHLCLTQQTCYTYNMIRRRIQRPGRCGVDLAGI